MSLGLSKSKYCKGVQCPKILWMDKYKPEEAEDVLPEAILATGNKVGDVARGYFGQYDLVEFDYDKNVMTEKTIDVTVYADPARFADSQEVYSQIRNLVKPLAETKKLNITKKLILMEIL